MIFITEDLPGSKTLLEKLATQTKPGAVIPLTEDEMKIMKSSYILGLSQKNSAIELIEVDPNKRYIAVVDENANIDDIFLIREHMEVMIGVVRVKS